MSHTAIHIVTQSYKLSANTYMDHTMNLWLWRHWYLIIIPIVPLVMSPFYGVAWAYLAMIMLLMIYPTAMLIVYFTHALTFEARDSLYCQHLVITNDGIRQTFVADEQFEKVPHDVTYTLDHVKRLSVNRKLLVIDLNTPPCHHLSVPLEAITEDDIDTLKQYFGTKFAV
jgi:hypothetical protein